jgi:hypothetical protein
VSDPLHPNRHFIVGVIILLLGLILLLDQLGFADARKIFLFWPLILVYFGVNKLVSSDDMTGRFWGGFLTLLGISFQLEELGLSRVRFGTIWPVFLICIGVLLVLRRYESRSAAAYYPPPPPPGPPPPGAPSTEPPAADASAPHPGSSETASPNEPTSPPQSNWAPNSWPGGDSWHRFSRRMERFSERANNPGQQPHAHWQASSQWYDSSEPRLNEVNVFWGGRRRIISKNFMGGEIVTVCGGFEIDLTQADFPGNQILIEVVTIFGGGEIRVPTTWEVIVDSVGIFGGTGDRTSHPLPANQDASGSAGPAASTKRLIVKGVSIFGGLTLKN